MDPRPIAIFDSGLGGLTVVREVRRLLPGESIVYFGDTARVPYGTKSPGTVQRFAEEDCLFLLRFDPKLIVVACNTASALALESLSIHADVPLVGVVEPGAEAAVEAVGGRPIVVIGTEATVASHAYRNAIGRLDPRVRVEEKACPSLVAMVEEGRSWRDPIVKMLLIDYLEPSLKVEPAGLVLGCTHYPLLRSAVAEIAGPEMVIIDSAEATARKVSRLLAAADALSAEDRPGKLRCFVSDNPQRLREVGSRFLGCEIEDVVWVSPEQFQGEIIASQTQYAAGPV